VNQPRNNSRYERMTRDELQSNLYSKDGIIKELEMQVAGFKA